EGKQSRPKLSLMPPATAISSQPPPRRTNSSACTRGSGSKCPTWTRPPFPAAASSSTRRAEVGYWSSGAAKHEAIARLTRQIPPCIATGEAAGTAAALAVKSGLNVKQLDVPVLQRQLRAQGAILD